MRARRMTSMLATRQRYANHKFNEDHAAEIDTLILLLLAHARRAGFEPLYVVPAGVGRQAWQRGLEGMAVKIRHRVELRLSSLWWLERGRELLLTCQRLNP